MHVTRIQVQEKPYGYNDHVTYQVDYYLESINSKIMTEKDKDTFKNLVSSVKEKISTIVAPPSLGYGWRPVLNPDQVVEIQ